MFVAILIAIFIPALAPLMFSIWAILFAIDKSIDLFDLLHRKFERIPYWTGVPIKDGIRDFTPEQRKQMAKDYEDYLKRSCN